jgi:cytochrome P450
LANHLFVLLSEPSLWSTLTSGEVSVESTVEELLRVMPFNDGSDLSRIGTQDVVVGDVTVRAGESVLINFACANRDAEVFENPDTVDLGRSPNPHRLELQETLGALRHLPGLRLAVPAQDVPWRGSAVRVPRTCR